jgi:hypothetical protein
VEHLVKFYRSAVRTTLASRKAERQAKDIGEWQVIRDRPAAELYPI